MMTTEFAGGDFFTKNNYFFCFYAFIVFANFPRLLVREIQFHSNQMFKCVNWSERRNTMCYFHNFSIVLVFDYKLYIEFRQSVEAQIRMANEIKCKESDIHGMLAQDTLVA